MSPPSASRKFTSPAIPNTANIFSTLTIIRSSIRSGNFTSAPYSVPATPLRCSSGMTASPVSKKCTTKPSRPIASSPPPRWRPPYEAPRTPAHHGPRGYAAAHLYGAHAAHRSRWPADAHLRRALHQAQRSAHLIRTPRNLQSSILVSPPLQHGRRFSRPASCPRCRALRGHVQGLHHRLPFALVYPS